MGGGPEMPDAPDIAKSYQEGIDVFLKNLPQMLASEQQYRTIVDPQRVTGQQALQDRYGTKQYQQQLDALNQIDPLGQNVRKELGGNIMSDLQAGYGLPKDYQTELENQIRGSQAARGNTLGAGAGSAEALFKGKNALDLYQQRLDNAGQFLQSPTPEQQLLAIQPVMPDRGSAYVSPTAGYQGQQFALNNYQNLMAQYQMAGGGGNAWQRALDGASKGSVGGPYGAFFGAVDGAANGPIYQTTTGGYSDQRLKEKVVFIGETSQGYSIYEFNWLGDDTRRTGVIAQEVARVKPEAVFFDEEGYLLVDYAQLC